MAGVAKELGPVGKRVAANIRQLRQARGMTMVEMSRRLTEVGRPLLDTGVLKTEQGERRVDVDDLVALAKALDVSASDLLFGEVAVSLVTPTVSPDLPS